MNGRIYENGKNYFYEISTDNEIIKIDEKKFIMYNINTLNWIVLDLIGYKIADTLSKYNDIQVLRDMICKEYNITSAEFEKDAIPLIELLIGQKFFITNNKTGENVSVHNKFIIDKNMLDSYPFNDMYISLSDECNLNCIYCFNKHSRHKRLKEKQLSLSYDMLKKVIKQFADLGGKKIVFTGGEPTLNENICDICKYVKNCGLKCMIITNGTRLKYINLPDFLINVDEIGISIDSINPYEIKKLWGCDNISVRQDIIENMVALNDACKKNTKSVVIMPVITSYNYKNIKGLIEVVESTLKNCIVSWDFSLYSPIGVKEIDQNLTLSEKVYQSTLYEAICSVQEVDNNKVMAYVLSDSGNELPRSNFRWMACAPSFFMTNCGDIYPCQGTENEEYKLGTILEDDLKNILYSEKFFSLINKTIIDQIEICKDCELRYLCTNVPRPCIEKKKECKKDFIIKMYLSSLIGGEKFA